MFLCCFHVFFCNVKRGAMSVDGSPNKLLLALAFRQAFMVLLAIIYMSCYLQLAELYVVLPISSQLIQQLIKLASQGLRNDTAIALIRPVFCFASEKRNIVGGAINFGFYIIIKNFSTFSHPLWSQCPQLFMFNNIFRKKSEKYYKISENFFFPEINKFVLVFINQIEM